MHPTLSLLERHQSVLDEQTVHWFDLPEPSSLLKSSDKQFNLLWSSRNNADEDQSIWPTAPLNVLFYPKAKERLDWWLKQLTSSLNESQTIWVVGENNGGIKSLPKRLKGLFESTKLDSARHCALYEISPIAPMPDQKNWHVFTTNDLDCYALPGVFSAGRLDKGSEIYLANLPQLEGNGLEFGGGCGVITSCVAKMSGVENITSVEIDLLATRSSRKTFAENQLEHKAKAVWSDGTSNLPNKQYDFIVSNPPFHQGIKTAYAPTEAFFQEAHSWLNRGGKFYWVANDFLNYQHILEAHFTSITTLAHDRGFKVFSALKK